MTPAPALAYQATDLSRNARQVLDAARHGGALIRDKDGVTLLMAPVEEREREREVSSLALDLVRAALAMFRGEQTAASFGDLSWVSVLPSDSQHRFFTELGDAVLLVASGMPMRNVAILLGDWRATAESWADPDTREQLLAGSDDPVRDREL